MLCKICRTPTGSNRPYCTNHISELPHIKSLQNYITSRVAEINDDDVNLNGHIAAEILELLEIRADATIEEISDMLDIERSKIDQYLTLMNIIGYVELEYTVARLTVSGLTHHHALQHLTPM